MRVGFISDLHGNNVVSQVEDLICKENLDKLIYAGDYFDSFVHTTKHILESFKELAYSSLNNSRIVLLIGNHDAHYFLHGDLAKECRGSGYRANLLFHVQELYLRYINGFYAAYNADGILYTHAGLTQSAFEYYYVNHRIKPCDYPNLADYFNDLWKYTPGMITQIGADRQGYHKHGSILWTDKNTLINDMLVNTTQVVGHSAVPLVQMTCNLEKDAKVYLTDTLAMSDEISWSIYENGELVKNGSFAKNKDTLKGD